jgi:hypothetical protein
MVRDRSHRSSDGQGRKAVGEFHRSCRQFYPIPLNQLTPTTGMRALP